MTGRKHHPLAARIKRLMQKDEDVGRIAQATPVLIGRAMELFLKRLCGSVADCARLRRAKTVTTGHLKACVVSDDMMDFLKDIVRSAPDLTGDDGQLNHRAKRQRMSPLGESSIEARHSTGGLLSPTSRRSQAPSRSLSLGSPRVANLAPGHGSLTQAIVAEAERYQSGAATSIAAAGPSRIAAVGPSRLPLQSEDTKKNSARDQAEDLTQGSPPPKQREDTSIFPSSSAPAEPSLQLAPCSAPQDAPLVVARSDLASSSTWPVQSSLPLSSRLQQSSVEALPLAPAVRMAPRAIFGVPAEEDDYDAEEEDEDEEEDEGEGMEGEDAEKR